jgi:hypothetical protein
MDSRMTTLSTTLLPVGIYDLLPPVAAHHVMLITISL